MKERLIQTLWEIQKNERKLLKIEGNLEKILMGLKEVKKLEEKKESKDKS